MNNNQKLVSFFVLTLSVIFCSQHIYEYVSPIPGSQRIKPEQTIVLRPGPVLSDFVENQENLIIVEGSNSGLHKGELILSDDRRTLIFKPNTPFAYGEIISVQVSKGIISESSEPVAGISFSFSIENDMSEFLNKYMPIHSNSFQHREITSQTTDYNLKHIPSLWEKSNNLRWEFPAISVLERNDPCSDYIFLSMKYIGGDETNGNFLAILDNYGNPVYYKYMSQQIANFQSQPGDKLSYYKGGANKYFIMDRQFAVIDSFGCQNGYSTNLHEFQLLENGHAIMLCSDVQAVQMDILVEGGAPIAMVTYQIIQEFDLDKNLIFQWRSLDHIPVTDAADFVDLTALEIDYMHGNSIDVDYDGNLLLSSRNLCEITKIDRSTGEIIWRFGGPNNQFEVFNDERGFSAQHHIRLTENGTYTIFDNGNYLEPEYSRAIEYEIDDTQLQATLIWEYNNNTDVFANGQGSTQRQVNGNTTIGWGVAPNVDVTEVRPDGSKALELRFPIEFFSYRAIRSAWENNLLQISPDSLYFNCTPEEIIDTSLTITNAGDQMLTLTGVNTYNELFAISGEFPQELAPDEFAEVTISFQSAECGIYDNILTVQTERSDEMIAKQISINVNVPCCLPGDVTEDGFVDILDIVAVVSHVLELTILPANVIDCADLDESGLIDILDIVILVEMIMD